MSISAVSTNSNYWSNSSNSVGQQSQQDFQELGQALQSGNLSGAQQAFSALQQLMPNASSSNSQTQTLPPLTGTNSISNDLSALTQAIQSGNQTDAQTDLTKLTQDLQSVKGKSHHHHHHHASTSLQDVTSASADSSASSSSSTSNTPTTAATSSSSVNSGISQYLAMMAIFQSSAGSSLNVSV